MTKSLTPKFTSQQLAALAALVGITPETHPWLCAPLHKQCGNQIRRFESDFGECKTCNKLLGKSEMFLELKLPHLSTAAGDDVFLAPCMRWATEQGLNPKVWGLYPISKNKFGANCRIPSELRGRTYDQFRATMTLAYLHAAQVAGVPEIVDIFNMTEKDFTDDGI